MLRPVLSGFLLALLVSRAATPLAAAVNGAVVFENHCASCHGLDGRARTPAGRKLQARDLSESRIADEAIVRQILEGVKDARGVDRMPSFKDRLSAEEVAAVRDHAKTFRKKP